jgi:PAB1-binding protein PBP1
MKKLVLIVTVLALAATASTYAGDKEGKRKGAPGQGRAPQMMEQLLPPPAVEKLNLDAGQKARYDELSAAFKAEAAQWRAQNPVTEADKEAMKKARESGDKEAMKPLMEKRKGLMEIRKKYVEQFKATLTDEQKEKLGEMRGTRGAKKCPKGKKS